MSLFLDAFSHLYKRVCPSVRLLVGWLVTHELKFCKSAVFDQNYWQYERERILCRVYGLVYERVQSSFFERTESTKPYAKLTSPSWRCLSVARKDNIRWFVIKVTFHCIRNLTSLPCGIKHNAMNLNKLHTVYIIIQTYKYQMAREFAFAQEKKCVCVCETRNIAKTINKPNWRARKSWFHSRALTSNDSIGEQRQTNQKMEKSLCRWVSRRQTISLAY